MDSMQMQALHVMEPDDNFDPNFEPQNGEEYLQKVIYERKKCPTIVVKPFKETNQLDNVKLMSDVVDNNSNIKMEIPMNLLPTREWEEIQLNQFSKLQNYIIELRQTEVIKYKLKDCKETPELPDYDHHENIWLEFLQINPPKLTIILQFENKLLTKLLQIISKYFCKEDNLLSINFFDNNFYNLSQWLYSLLICLHLPIEPNIYNVMRLIARFFLQQRNNYCNFINTSNNDNADLISKNIIPINLFIVIISKYFKQFDLLNE